MASERVILEVRDGVAEARLNRPEKLNALDGEMFAAIRAAIRTLAADPKVRAVVLSGEGRAFCAGLDMGSFAAMAGGPREGGVGELARRAGASPANAAQSVAWGWTELAVPVIAAVHGVAFGGGLQIALGADIRIVAPDARLSIMEIKWGLVPDMAGTQLLRRLARLDVVKELTYSGRIVSGAEAVALGLATRVSDDPHAAARALAREIAEKSPHAIRAAKQLLDASHDVGVEAGLALEEKLQLSLIGQPNQVEAVRSNLEKRAPRFTDPVD
jgi:enoyl-CoA hydratase/carnithine racemase